jgi:hypothetical protein
MTSLQKRHDGIELRTLSYAGDESPSKNDREDDEKLRQSGNDRADMQRLGKTQQFDVWYLSYTVANT